ncbi:MAG: rubrerythrin family protein [Intestinimonas sp.]|nr:rubrerythrin family protein [Intestinimonas sp.]
MSVEFAQSKTKENLMRAFAGESQARNRYTFAAGLARTKGLAVVERVFLFTADQERAHGKIYYDLLAQCSGENIRVDGAYPVDLYSGILEHLKAARHNELEEGEKVYPAFADMAREEGFPEVSKFFSDIAAVERVHSERFSRFAELVEQDRLFVSEGETRWMCLNCGHIVNAAIAPALCPVCKHGQGFFIRMKFIEQTGL